MRLPTQIARQIRRDPITGCWHWTGTQHHGAPMIGRQSVRRRLYDIAFGVMPHRYQQLRTHCASDDCVRPAHLVYLGTADVTFVAMARAGASLEEIRRRCRITRQGVHQRLHVSGLWRVWRTRRRATMADRALLRAHRTRQPSAFTQLLLDAAVRGHVVVFSVDYGSCSIDGARVRLVHCRRPHHCYGNEYYRCCTVRRTDLTVLLLPTGRRRFILPGGSLRTFVERAELADLPERWPTPDEVQLGLSRCVAAERRAA
jgi:hypothetical protein